MSKITLDDIFDENFTPDNFDDDDVVDAPIESPDDTVEEIEEPAEVVEEIVNEEPEPQDPLTQKFVDFLTANDIFEVPENFELDGSEESIQKILEYTKQQNKDRVAQEIWSALPDDFKPLLEYGLNGGKSIKEFLDVYVDSDVTTLDISQEANQRAVLREYYKQTSNGTFSQEKIDRLIKRIEEYGDLEEEAKDAHQELSRQSNERKQALILEAQRKEQEQRQHIIDYTNAMVDSIEKTSFIHPTRKAKVRSFMFDPIQINSTSTTAYNYAVQSILANPEHQAQLADILLDYNPEKGFDLERLERRVRTKASKSFQELLEQKLDPKSKTKGSVGKDRKVDFDFKQFLNI